MPKARSYREILESGLKRLDFIEKEEARAQKRRPRRVGLKPNTGTLFAIRNKRLAIREAALRRVQIVITYRKITTGEIKKYVVAPYEWKNRILKVGRRKMLWAYDMEDRHIKSFVQRNIRNVALTNRKYVPKWPVKID